jgi:hypothetical protein
MARYHYSDFPMGSVLSCSTMRIEDLIPSFVFELTARRRRKTLKRSQAKELRDIEKRLDSDEYFTDEDADYDLVWLFEALNEYAAPYFYFGSHPGDRSDYGYWLSEGFADNFDGLKVNDTADIDPKYRGEVLHVNDHGNCTLYVKTSRKLHEVWSIV